MKVDLIFNCYEKTYARVLDKSFIKSIVNQNKISFENIFIVINNVKNKKIVQNIAEKLKKDGNIANFFRVEDYLPKVLQQCNIEDKDIKALRHYIDRALVCAYIAKSQYFVHRDSDVYLETPIDWIAPCIEEMNKNKNILISNPLRKEYKVEGKFWYKESSNFYYSYGFSDQLYLARKYDLLKDIYRYTHIYTSRFPLYPIGKTFEAMIDAYMRKESKTRLVFKNTIYVHELGKGSPYPKYSFFQYIKRISMFLIRNIYCKLGYRHNSNTTYL